MKSNRKPTPRRPFEGEYLPPLLRLKYNNSIVNANAILGRPNEFGSVFAVIQKGMNLTGIQSFDQKIVLGAVLLAAVLIDTLKRRSGSK